MRNLWIAQIVPIVVVGALMSGCPTAPGTEPTGGQNCVPTINCSSSTSSGGEGGKVNTGGGGGAGNNGSGGSGGKGGSSSGAAGSGTGGAGTGGSGTGGAGTGGAGTGGAGTGGMGTGGMGTGGKGTGGSGTGGMGTGGMGMGGMGSGGSGVGGKGGNLANCEKLEAEIKIKQEASQTCNPEIPPSLQCQAFVTGLCCPIAVNDVNSPEVVAYLEALQQFVQKECEAKCPPDPCPPTPQANCMASGGLQGTCVVLP